jgi:hypothetical protein
VKANLQVTPELKGDPVPPPLRGSLRCSPSRALPHKGTPTFYPLKRMKDRMRNSPWQTAHNAVYCGAQTVLADFPRLGCATRRRKRGPQNRNSKTTPCPGFARTEQKQPAQSADCAFFEIPFCAAEVWQLNWDEGEHCLSSAAACVLCKLSGRVAQPPNLTANPKGRRSRVPFCLVTLFWACKIK